MSQPKDPKEPIDPIVHFEDAPEECSSKEAPWGGHWRVLTPQMEGAGGQLNLIMNRLPPGCVGSPFHWHMYEDEVFYILSGRGVLRYGDSVRPLKPGDCVTCPAGTRLAHQIANPDGDEDLVYLAAGLHLPQEVCGYPDNGKVMVRALKAVGRLESLPYMDGEPDPPLILSMEPSKD